MYRDGQAPVVCSLCEEDTRIKWKCLNCDMLMCDKCKKKIHVKFKFAKDHKVVSLQEAGLHAEEIDFSHTSCKTHAGQSCVLFCKSCDFLVCPQCISETHNGHGLVAIKEGYETQIDQLKTGQKYVRTNIEELQKRKADVVDLKRTEHCKFEKTMKKIKDQNIMLKNKVDTETEKLATELTKRWEDLHLCTDKEEKEVSLLIRSLESRSVEVDEIVKSKQAEKVFVDGLELKKSMEKAVTLPSTKFDSIPTFFPGQLSAYNIGALEHVSTKDKIKIIKQFSTEISNINYLAACLNNTLWITDQKILQKVKIEGRSLKVIDQKDLEIYGMACTPSGDLLLVAGGSVLKQISGRTGELTDAKYGVEGSVLSSVHVNLDGKVTVGAFFGGKVFPAVGRRVVIAMDTSGKHETTYEFDNQGNPLYTYVNNITRTKNGSICVVDTLSEDETGRVVIVSEDGTILNTFNGHPEINTDDIPFEPIRLFTSPDDNIIVSNQNESIIYFLNNLGNYIGYCDTSEMGMIFPCTFSSTEAKHTYVGCLTSRNSAYKAKIYEVNIL